MFTDVAKGKETLSDGVITSKVAEDGSTISLKTTEDDGILTTSDRLMPNIEATLYKINDDGTEEKVRCKTLLATKYCIPCLSDNNHQAESEKLIGLYRNATGENKTIEELNELYQYNTEESIRIARLCNENGISNTSSSVVLTAEEREKLNKLKDENIDLNDEISKLKQELKETEDKLFNEVSNDETGNYLRELEKTLESYIKVKENVETAINVINGYSTNWGTNLKEFFNPTNHRYEIENIIDGGGYPKSSIYGEEGKPFAKVGTYNLDTIKRIYNSYSEDSVFNLYMIASAGEKVQDNPDGNSFIDDVNNRVTAWNNEFDRLLDGYTDGYNYYQGFMRFGKEIGTSTESKRDASYYYGIKSITSTNTMKYGWLSESGYPKQVSIYFTRQQITNYMKYQILSEIKPSLENKKKQLEELIPKIQATIKAIKDDCNTKNDEIKVLQEKIDSNNKKIQDIFDNYSGVTSESKADALEKKITQAESESDYTRRMNSTLTDENGYYEFRGLITTNKYIVKFKYNGQDYLPTDYLVNMQYNEETGKWETTDPYKDVQEMVGENQYSTGEENLQWQQTSKALETEEDRINYDKRFEEIGSSPHNYKTTNSLGFFGSSMLNAENLKDGDSGWYNETYSELELLGYKLTEDGIYIQPETETQLIDGYVREKDGTYKIDENGNTNAEYKEGAITLKIKEFISTNKRYPDDNDLNDIYRELAGENANILKQIQFIEDCKIQASTQNKDGEIDTYPVYDKFTTDPEDVTINGAIVMNWTNYTYDGNGKIIGIDTDCQEYQYIVENAGGLYEDTSETYKAIYPGQLEINLGLWERQKTDMALKKDLYKAATKINGKTEVYNYDKRNQDDYWDIQVRMEDYQNYYGTGYTRELYKSDYNAVANETITNKLDVYVTYKITVRNQSSSILTRIPEVVDYFDEDYEYQDGLSWVTYQGEEEKLDENGNIVNENIVKDDEYYNMMVDANVVVDANSPTIAENNIPNYKDPKAESDSIYGSQTMQGIGKKEYYELYIQGLEDKKLASGESAYIYLTFKVKADNNGTYLRDDINSETGKENYAEINGYETFYRKGTSLPNKVTKGENDIAGLIDVDSKPGNLKESDINEGNKYEKNFEDDTDRSKTLRLVVTDDTRQINGTVWEDIRNTESGIAEIGNGILDEKEPKIAGVTVTLYEVEVVNGKPVLVNEKPVETIAKIWDGTSWKNATTTTGKDGKYEFNGYIPGDYIVRFEYGDTEATVLKSDKKAQSYNGQDYKSTTYQKGIDDATKATETETAQYNYDIAKSDLADLADLDLKKIELTEEDLEKLEKPEPSEEEKKEINEIIEKLKKAEPKSIISDAKDIMSRREEVEKYSNENVTNSKAEILVSPNDVPKYNDREYSESEMTSLINQLIENTKMRAETGIINVEFEYNRSETDGLNGSSNNNGIYLYGNDCNGKYVLNNVSLGLEQRPQAQLKTTKQITNVKVTLANGNTLFDASGSGTDVLWRVNEVAHGPDKNNKYTTNENYEKNIMKESVVRSDTTKKGVVQLTMDEELMHGATIKITYAITIANIGEVDYKGSKGSEGSDGEYKFYYTGEKGDKDSIVTTTVNQIIDYVGTQTTDDDNATRNNLEFIKADNSGWNVINIGNLLSDNLINAYLEENAKKYNTIVEYTFTGDGNGKALVPIIADNTAEGISKAFDGNPSTALATVDKTSSVVGTQLVLSKTITSDNNTDDMTYNNMVEIVKTGNTVGRRMAYSVVGNQNPLSLPEEVDADAAEEVIILPPFGQNYIYYIIGTVVGIITIGGVILIIRKVLKK